MIGNSANPGTGCARSRAQISAPSISGISKSSTRRSTGSDSMIRNASAPLAHVSTANPRGWSAWRSRRREAGSSSTTRTCGGVTLFTRVSGSGARVDIAPDSPRPTALVVSDHAIIDPFCARNPIWARDWMMMHERRLVHTHIPPVIGVVALIAILYLGREFLLPIALAVLIAFLLVPLIRR